jgi:hypothetical protein
MSELEFIIMAIQGWPSFVSLSVLFAVLLFLVIRRVIVGGIFDPLVLALVVGYSVNYAVVAFLWIFGQSSTYLTFLVALYGVCLLVTFRWVSRQRKSPRLLGVLRALTPRHVGPLVYRLSIFVYAVLSLFIISSIGFGIFAENNRFEAARGFGGYIRIMDFLGPFIVSYSTVAIASQKRHRVLKSCALVVFIFYAAMVNGAKISVIFSLCTVFFTLSIMAIKVRIRPDVAIVGMLAGLAFSVIALGINLDRNEVDEGLAETGLTGAGLVVERFVYRVIASGDSSYLLLPNNVIDRIEKDNAVVRFLVPFIGITTASRIFGYPVGDYSVGRQALLYYDPGNEISGGPTSHFDLFGYVYFGALGGALFSVAVGAMLGSINRSIREVRRDRSGTPNRYLVALLATLWTRAVLVIIEPTVAVAFVVDVLVFFAFTSFVLLALVPRRRDKAGAVAAPGRATTA